MNYKRGKCRRQVRDPLATSHRWKGNASDRFAPGQEPGSEQSTVVTAPLPPPRVRKRFVLEAMAVAGSMLPGHPWNCGYRTWASWGKRFHLRKSAEQAFNSALSQHGSRLYFRIREAR